MKELSANCAGAQVDWREVETILKAWSGALKVLPSPAAGFGVRLAPSSTTSKLLLDPFMAGSGGPWFRGRLELDPICVVGGAQRGEAVVPCSRRLCPSHTAQSTGQCCLGFQLVWPLDGPLGGQGGQSPCASGAPDRLVNLSVPPFPPL